MTGRTSAAVCNVKKFLQVRGNTDLCDLSGGKSAYHDAIGRSIAACGYPLTRDHERQHRNLE